MPSRRELRLSIRVALGVVWSLCAWVPPSSAQLPPRSDAIPPHRAAREGAEAESSGIRRAVNDSASERSAPGASEDATSAGEVTLRARVITGFEYERERPAGNQEGVPQSEYGFRVQQMRVGVRADLADLFRLRATFDVADALSPELGGSYSSPEYIRTASIEYRPSRAFRLEVGRFKRPFSRLELESTADLPILNRGLFNELGIEDNQWGDRAIGSMASGRIKDLKLRWYLSLMNPGWSSVTEPPGVDVIGRVELELLEPLTLAAGGGYKYVRIGNEAVHSWAVGADLVLDVSGFRLLLEALSADLPFAADGRRGFGIIALLDYRWELTANWALQPTFAAELADAHATLSQSESTRLVFGVNVLGYDGFRLMPQVALVRSIGDTSNLNPWRESETYSLVFSLVL